MIQSLSLTHVAIVVTRRYRAPMTGFVRFEINDSTRVPPRVFVIHSKNRLAASTCKDESHRRRRVSRARGRSLIRTSRADWIGREFGASASRIAWRRDADDRCRDETCRRDRSTSYANPGRVCRLPTDLTLGPPPYVSPLEHVRARRDRREGSREMQRRPPRDPRARESDSRARDVFAHAHSSRGTRRARAEICTCAGRVE